MRVARFVAGRRLDKRSKKKKKRRKQTEKLEIIDEIVPCNSSFQCSVIFGDGFFAAFLGPCKIFQSLEPREPYYFNPYIGDVPKVPEIKWPSHSKPRWIGNKVTYDW
jgi:hypothetical protein